MNRRTFLKMMSAGVIGGSAMSTTGCFKNGILAKKPNILIISADNVGYSDISPFGGEIDTPTLQRLAGRGLRYTQFYNSAGSNNTRASLLTGLYSQQAAGLKKNAGSIQNGLNNSCVTIAQVLKDAGYGTYMTGKWHAAKKNDKVDWPLQCGFEHFYGTLEDSGNSFTPESGVSLYEDNKPISMTSLPQDYYYTDAITDKMIGFLQNHFEDSGDKPFFAYMAHSSHPFPLKVRDEEIQKYKGKYDIGWDVVRKLRYQHQINVGVINSNWSLAPRPETVPAWANLSKGKQHEFAKCMESHAARVESMDRTIGCLIDFLSFADVLDNTLFFFLADNSGDTPDKDLVIGTAGNTLNETKCRQAWTHVCDTPFSSHENYISEGSIAMPLIFQWPDVLQERGEVRQQLGHVTDIMPTCLEAAEAGYPKEYNGQKVQPVEGVSLIPTFINENSGRTDVYIEDAGDKVVRYEKWKIVSEKGKEWQLYDMENDRSETKDLASIHPDIVRKLEIMWNAWAERCDVEK